MYLLSFIICIVSPILASPVNYLETAKRDLFKRAYYELYCPFLLPNPPPAPLVVSLGMRSFLDPETGFLALDLRDYATGEGDITDILYTSDQLCDRAGCRCVGSTMLCSIEGTRFYNSAISALYHEKCASRCRCVEEIDSDPDSDTTWSSAGSAASSDGESDGQPGGGSDGEDNGSEYSDDSIYDHWAHNMAVIRANYDHGKAKNPVHDKTCLPSRLGQCNSCMAGPAAGWTLKSTDCCPEYSLETITPQEAFTQFAMPVSILITNHISVGVCMPIG